MTELELTDPPPRIVAASSPPGVRPYDTARVLVRLQGEPIGQMPVALVDGEADVNVVLLQARMRFDALVADQLGLSWSEFLVSQLPTLSQELAELDGTDLPGISVVIGTRDRPDHAVACVAGVLKQSYRGPIEVIVVDNAPSSSATEHVIADRYGEDHRVHYILEQEPGLSRARNIGFAAATHDFVAFLSDDIQVDTMWLRAVIRGFRRSDSVQCVVGFSPPLYLDSEEQQVFEQTVAWGWRNGFDPILIESDDTGDGLHPYRVGIGNGANIAFRTDTFRKAGGFDERLGPGTLARGGEDLAASVQVLLDGGALSFEPAALGWHADRYDDREFTSHMYTYGVGLTAFFTSHLAASETRRTLLKKIPFGARHLLTTAILPESEDRFDPFLARTTYRLANLAGRAAGPLAFIRSAKATIPRIITNGTIGAVAARSGLEQSGSDTGELEPAE